MSKVGLVACLVLLVAPATAVAGEEHFTLDGAPSTNQVASTAAGGCAASASPSGEIACFSTEKALITAAARAARDGQIPPGWAVLPTSEQAAVLAQGSGVASAASRKRKRATRRVRARASAADQCALPTYTRVWTNANQGGTLGYIGYSGYVNWQDHSSTFNNEISSYNNMSSYYVSRWHDLAGGQGSYYNYSYLCRYAANLQNSPLGSNTWNDRFSSWASW